MTKDKYLFLDIDGVLNTVSSFIFWKKIMDRDHKNYTGGIEGIYKNRSEDFSPDALANLYYIIQETKCKIVISSSWRQGIDLEGMKSWFENIPLIADAIIDKTPSMRVSKKIPIVVPEEQRDLPSDRNVVLDCPRGMEIKCWLEENGIQIFQSDRFAIVDDDSDMWPLSRYHFKTNSYDGLTFTIAQKIIDFLTKGGGK